MTTKRSQKSDKLEPPKMKSSKKKYSLIIVLLLTVVAIASGGYYYYSNYYNRSFNSTEDETRFYVEKLAKVIKLPNGEVVLATVNDTSQLKDQIFFKDAENGDKVLIFPQEQQAILYRPSENIIVHIGPISYLQNNSPTPSVEQSLEAKILLLNGSGKSGLAGAVEQQIKNDLGKDYSIDTSLDNASNTYYDGNLVVVNNKSLEDLANKISKLIGAKIGDLPSGEPTYDSADIIVILGK